MKIAILSDIHANLTALNSVLVHCIQNYGNEIKYAHLGDCIDYGMRPNEVIERIKSIDFIVNLQGNHERALFGFEMDKFSSLRAKQANEYTKSILNKNSTDYLKNNMNASAQELCINNRKLLFLHGDLSDLYWGKMSAEEMHKEDYKQYDYVISAHTHIPHLQYVVNKAQNNKVIFINPGSVGQPRNYNCNAQYAVIDTKTDEVIFESVPYEIEAETALYNGSIDDYYHKRLRKGC